jgi:hypothetical protein
MSFITHVPVPLSCITSAAIIYHVPVKVIISILQVEGGKPGKIEWNKNGTYDMGPMQINSSWLPELNRHGITKNEMIFDPCTNIKVGTWILAQAIASENNLLTGIGNYNSHTKQHNQSYYQKVRIKFTKIHIYLTKGK